MTEGWLSGWKAIANYINYHIDTAKTYAKEYGMPVHKSPGGGVTAITYELDQWLIGYNKAEKRKKGFS